MITFNTKDFKGVDQFGIQALPPAEYLRKEKYIMSSITVRLPDSVHRKVKEVAKEDGVSINQFISSAVGEKLASVLTASYLEERARKGNRDRFKKVLAKVPDREALEKDCL
ncbi:MAG: YlcI/YnfO family protein [Verrucomicrobiota bacterium]